MKPITDDIIHSLIERAESRERILAAANDPIPLSRSSMFARRGARIILFEQVHPALRLRETVSGVFCYAQRT